MVDSVALDTLKETPEREMVTMPNTVGESGTGDTVSATTNALADWFVLVPT